MDLKRTIRVIEDFPEPGISFKDITTLLKDKDAFHEAIHRMEELLKDKKIDLVVGPEARGFLFGPVIAYLLGVGFAPVRKPGKLPAKARTYHYDLEYGTDTLEIHEDAIKPGMRVALVDDLLATGGTMNACAKLIEEAGGEVVSIAFLIELTELGGRDKLSEYDVHALVSYGH